MKKFVPVFLLLTVGFLGASGEEMRLEFKLESSAKTLRLGQSTTLELKITGSDLSKITEDTEGLEADLFNRSEFVNKFRFRPQREGEFTFGPYYITVNGQELESNSIEILVLPQWDGEYGTFFRVNKDSVVLGEEIELVVETWSEKRQNNSMFIENSNESFTTRPGGRFWHHVSARETQITCTSQTWHITPTQSGVFTISREMFRKFPEDVDPPSLEVEVKEPSQSHLN